MRKVPLRQSLQIIKQGSLNWRAERPLVVSFEVTDACTCFCKHCDHGGLRDTSRDMKPADYGRYMDVLKPVVVQVSGRRAAHARRPRGRGSGDSPAERPAVRHPRVQLVAHDARALRGVCARRASISSASAWICPTSATTTSAVTPGLYEHLSQIVPGGGEARLRQHLSEQLHHVGERGVHQRRGGQGEGVGRQHQLQRLLTAPHRLPRLLPDDRGAVGDAARRAGAPQDPHRQPLGDQLGHDDRRHRSATSRRAGRRAARPACAGWW